MGQNINIKPSNGVAILYREPKSHDGALVHRLIAACSPLDENSLYANLLQCTHFHKTCIVAEFNSEIQGWISGYRLPDEPNTLFVWQVAVAKEARGLGVGKGMLRELLARPELKNIEYIKTTITLDNSASWALFKSFAEELKAQAESELYFDQNNHLAGEHPSEHVFTIGPFTR